MAAQASESESGKVTVRLGGETRDRLEREASAERRPLASMAKLLIEDALAARARRPDMAIEAHLQNVQQAEHDRQAAMVADVSAAAAKAADIAYHRARLKSALEHGVSPSASMQALRALGAEPTEPPPPVAMPKAAAVSEKPEPTATATSVGEPIGYADEEAEDEEGDAREAAGKPKSKHKR